jgi:hypothetical protein
MSTSTHSITSIDGPLQLDARPLLLDELFTAFRAELTHVQAAFGMVLLSALLPLQGVVHNFAAVWTIANR